MDHAKMVETATRLSIEYAISYDDALRRLKYLETIDAEWAHRISALEAANAELKARAEAAEAKVKAEKDTWMHQQDRHMEEMGQVVRERDEARAERDTERARADKVEGKVAAVRERVEKDRVIAQNKGTATGAAVVYFADRLLDHFDAPVEATRVTVPVGGSLLLTQDDNVTYLSPPGPNDHAMRVTGGEYLLVRCKP